MYKAIKLINTDAMNDRVTIAYTHYPKRAFKQRRAAHYALVFTLVSNFLLLSDANLSSVGKHYAVPQQLSNTLRKTNLHNRPTAFTSVLARPFFTERSGERVSGIRRAQCLKKHKLHMMPIGIPKVAYTIPGTSSAEWIDIYNRLYRERIIFLSQELDDEFANQMIGIMLYLDCEDSSRPIYLYINCPGGSVISGLAVYDTMQHIKSEVVTINVGLAASMASFLLAGGAKGKRLALPHSRTMIHQPSGGAEGQAEDLKVEAAQILRVKNDIVEMYSRMTGMAQERVALDLNRDKFMSAQEAKEYGLIDHVIELKRDEPKITKQDG